MGCARRTPLLSSRWLRKAHAPSHHDPDRQDEWRSDDGETADENNAIHSDVGEADDVPERAFGP